MEKRISYDEFMAVKRVAQAVNPLTMKRDKVAKKMESLKAEYNGYDTQIAALEAGIKQIIGFRVEDLVRKVIEPAMDKEGNPVVDHNGKPLKTTKYVPTDIVSYDKDNKQYVITTPDEESKENESFE